MEILALLQPIDVATGARVDIRLCSSDDARITGASSQRWWPAITRRPSLSLNWFDGDFNGQISTGNASMEVSGYGLKKADAGAPARAWAGAPVTLWAIDPAVGTPVQIFTGLVERVRNVAEAISIDMRVNTEPFVVNAMTTTYAGTGGAEGPIDLAGKIKPLLLGRCFNVEPVLIDVVNNVYQVSAYGPIESIEVLYERASAFGASTGDHASYAALVAASIAPGQWATCLAAGMFRLGAPAYGLITADVRGDKPGGTWVRKTGEIISRMCSIAGVPSGNIDAVSLAALDSALSALPNQGRIGLYLTDQTRLLDIVQRLVRPCNAAAGIGFDGKMFVCRTAIGSPVATFDAQGRQRPAVSAIGEESVSPPFSRIEMQGARNWRVQTDSEIAQGALPADEVAGLRLLADAEGFTFTDQAANPSSQTITFTAQLTGLSGTASFSTTPGVTLGGTGNTRTLAVADFGSNRQVTVQATLAGITDRITVVRLERNIVAPNAANRVPFSRFERGMADWPITDNTGGVPTTTFAGEVEGRRVGLRQFQFTAAGQTCAFRSQFFPTEGGRRLSVQARLGIETAPAVAFWGLFILYFDQSSSFISSQTVASGTALPAWRDPPVQVFLDIPAGARTAYIQFNVDSAGAGNVDAIIAEPHVATAAPQQTAHPAFTPGPNAQDGADVTGQNTALDTLNVAGVSAASLVADAATAKADAAQSKIDLEAIANDSIITEREKVDVRERRTNISAEYPIWRDRAIAFGVNSAVRASYDDGYNAMITYLTAIGIDNPGNSTVVRADFVSAFVNYATTREVLIDAISVIASQRATVAGAEPGLVNSNVPTGGNSVVNSDFTRGLYGFTAGTLSETGGFAVSAGINLSPEWSGQLDVLWASVNTGGAAWSAGVNTYADVVWTRGRWKSGSMADQRTFGMPCKQGDRLFARSLIARHRCDINFFLLIFDKDGELVEAPSWSGGRVNGAGGGIPSNFDEIGGIHIVVHSAAASAALMWRVQANGGADPFMFMARPVMGILPPGQTALPPYTRGPNDPVADLTSESVPILVLPPTTIIRANFEGTPDAGQLPRVLQASAFRGGVNVTSTAGLSLQISPAGAASASINSSGAITITAMPARIANLTVIPTLPGLAPATFTVERQDAPPPMGGGGGTGTSASTSALASFDGSSFVAVASLTVITGAGTVSASAPLDISTNDAGGAFNVIGKFQRWTGAAWVDMGGEVTGLSAITDGEPSTINISASASGLGTSASIDVRLVMRTTTSGRTVNLSGTFSAVGS